MYRHRHRVVACVDTQTENDFSPFYRTSSPTRAAALLHIHETMLIFVAVIVQEL